jgi:hypothetical protein
MQNYKHFLFKACADTSSLVSTNPGIQNKLRSNSCELIIIYKDDHVFDKEDLVPENFYHQDFVSTWNDKGICAHTHTHTHSY